ncbi:g6366 [Coccomyxa elongata]
MPSLRAAVIYSLSVFAQRRPILHRVLDWEDEFFALVTAFLDRQSLANSSATFADTLYGLRRAPYAPSEPSRSLTPREQNATLMFLVGVPYVKAKLEALYNRHRRPTEGLLGLTLRRPLVPQSSTATQQNADQREAGGGSSRWQHRLAQARALGLAAFMRLYPWLHMVQEGLSFSYQLAYLLQASPYFSPTLHILRQHVERASGQQLALADRAKRQQRRQEITGVRSSGNFIVRLVQEGVLRAGYALSDHTRNALILAIFGFKLLEWWYTSAEDKLATEKKLAPPPPPPPPMPAPDGVPLPSDPSLCPLCRQARTNAAMTTVSGYAFCYPCLFNFISQEGCCPVTRIPATIDSVRRLYQST